MSLNIGLARMPSVVRLWLQDQEILMHRSHRSGGMITSRSRGAGPVPFRNHWTPLPTSHALDKRRHATVFNTFGGLKVTFPEPALPSRPGRPRAPYLEVDVWPMHLEDFFALSYDKPRSALRLQPYSLIKEVTR